MATRSGALYLRYRSRERGPNVLVGSGSEAGRIGLGWGSGCLEERRRPRLLARRAIRRTIEVRKGLASSLSLEGKCELEWYQRTQENLRASTHERGR